ncbi:hypothetical protein SNEBB_008122 [Seison nebaliae]|nr:hypothetical protein SNEBB_008122 [Seison nebaliae]
MTNEEYELDDKRQSMLRFTDSPNDTDDNVAMLNRNPKTCGQKVKIWCKENMILLLIIGGVLIGSIIGIILRQFTLSETAITIIGFPGEIFMKMLKMLILPLIVSSLVSALARLDPKSSGRMGGLAILYYFSTTFIAAILGLVLVIAIHPGNPDAHHSRQMTSLQPEGKVITTLDSILDLLRNLFPENLASATFQQAYTKYVPIENKNSTLLNDTVIDYKRTVDYKDGMNLLGIITFCTVFGLYIGSMGVRAKPMAEFFNILYEIVMKLVQLLMWFSPIGIASLIISNLVHIKDINTMVQSTGKYMATVLAGLLIHFVVNLPLIYFACTRKNPVKFLKSMLSAVLTALGTSSSAATLPVTFDCLENKNKLDPRVTRFVLPIGATINMDGTALYEAVAPIFIAQMNGIQLTPVQYFTVTFTATVASIGAASIPSAGLVTMMLVLTSVGLPTEDISLIFAVDWMLDRIRTATNVWGDSVGAGIVHHFSKAHLAKLDEIEQKELEEEQMNEQHKLMKMISEENLHQL